MQVPPLRRRSDGSGRDDNLVVSSQLSVVRKADPSVACGDLVMTTRVSDSPGRGPSTALPSVATLGMTKKNKMQVPPLRRRSDGSGRDDKTKTKCRSLGCAPCGRYARDDNSRASISALR